MELIDSFKPLITFSQLSGLGSFTIKTQNGREYLKPSNFLKVYSFLVFILISVLIIFIHEDRSGTAELTDSASLTADKIDTYGFIVTCVISYLIHNSHNDDICEVINEILDLGKEIKIEDSVLRFDFKFICFDIIASTLYEGIYAYVSIEVAPYDYLNFWYYVWETMTYVFLETFSFVVIFQFIRFVHIVKSMLKVVNKCILEYIKEETQGSEEIQNE